MSSYIFLRSPITRISRFFSNFYPNCKKLNKLTISGEEISNLAGLQVLDSVGRLILEETLVTRLDELSVTLYASLTLVNNLVLVDADLPHGQTFGTILLENNPLLHHLDMSSVRSINTVYIDTDSLFLELGNTVLQSLYLIGDVEVQNVEPIILSEDLFLIGCSYYDSFFKVFQNFEPDNLLLLGIGSIDSFNTFGYQPLTLRGSFGLIDIPIFVTSPNDIQPSQVDDLRIFEMGDLSDLSFFSEFETNQVHLRDNPSLANLSGLENSAGNLTKVELLDNTALTDISALAEISPEIPKLTIKDNPMLTYCHYAPICEKVAADGDNPLVVIEGNAGDCIDEPALLQACITATDESGDPSMSFYPNPVGEVLSVSESIKPIALYNVVGVQVATYEQQLLQSVDLSHIQSGAYILRYETQEGEVRQHWFLKM